MLERSVHCSTCARCGVQEEGYKVREGTVRGVGLQITPLSLFGVLFSFLVSVKDQCYREKIRMSREAKRGLQWETLNINCGKLNFLFQGHINFVHWFFSHLLPSFLSWLWQFQGFIPLQGNQVNEVIPNSEEPGKHLFEITSGRTDFFLSTLSISYFTYLTSTHIHILTARIVRFGWKKGRMAAHFMSGLAMLPDCRRL